MGYLADLLNASVYCLETFVKDTNVMICLSLYSFCEEIKEPLRSCFVFGTETRQLVCPGGRICQETLNLLIVIVSLRQ